MEKYLKERKVFLSKECFRGISFIKEIFKKCFIKEKVFKRNKSVLLKKSKGVLKK